MKSGGILSKLSSPMNYIYFDTRLLQILEKDVANREM